MKIINLMVNSFLDVSIHLLHLTQPCVSILSFMAEMGDSPATCKSGKIMTSESRKCFLYLGCCHERSNEFRSVPVLVCSVRNLRQFLSKLTTSLPLCTNKSRFESIILISFLVSVIQGSVYPSRLSIMD